MQPNIPIYRAKKIDSVKYVEGFYFEADGDKLIITTEWNANAQDYESHFVDPLTLAIHFPDMIDSEGTKIFASLSEDGKGGSECRLFCPMGTEFTDTLCRKNKTFLFRGDGAEFTEVSESLKVTGIQE